MQAWSSVLGYRECVERTKESWSLCAGERAERRKGSVSKRLEPGLGNDSIFFDTKPKGYAKGVLGLAGLSLAGSSVGPLPYWFNWRGRLSQQEDQTSGTASQRMQFAVSGE